MNIKSTVYENTIGIEFNPDDFHAMDLSPRVVIDSSGGTCVLVPTKTAIAMRDKLNDFFPPESDEPELGLPEEPKEDGYYLTPQSVLLIKDTYSWHRPSCRWKDGKVYTGDWGVVCETLGAEAFPLTKLNTGTEAK